ncbi:MAG: ABC transporter ATP-binding protein [Bacilli bacterium]|nr:ABC transporter ATP-binding protein [Bacilli bacterium]
MKNKETLRFINDNIKGCKTKIALLSICQILLGVLTVAFSFMLKFIIESIQEGSKDKLLINVVIIASIALCLILLQIFYRIYYEVSYTEIENKLKNNLFKTILNKDYQEIKKTHDEEWIHRLTSDTSVIANSILSILPSLCRMVVQLVLALAAIIYLYPIFGLSLLPFILLVILITYFMRKRLKAYHHLVQEKDGKAKVFFFESLQGLSIVHSFVKEDIFSKKNERNLEEYKKARLKRNMFAMVCSISFLVVYYAFYIMAIVFCGNAIIDGLMTIGLLTALVALLSQLTGPLGNITSIIPRYYSLLASGERLKIEKDEAINYLSKEEIKEFYDKEFKDITLKNVSFSYLDKFGNRVEALKDFNLVINKNERILIKGHSGGGKTTLFKILLNLLKPESGEVLLNDASLDASYERLFAYVPQDNLLMQGTIKEVVTLFNEDVDIERFNKALELSSSSNFVNELALKEETYLNEKGSGLSLGEMERIAIARAIYSESPIMLLDECSASLDLETEKKVISNILNMKDKTIVLISHHKYDEKLFDKVIDLGE